MFFFGGVYRLRCFLALCHFPPACYTLPRSFPGPPDRRSVRYFHPFKIDRYECALSAMTALPCPLKLARDHGLFLPFFWRLFPNALTSFAPYVCLAYGRRTPLFRDGRPPILNISQRNQSVLLKARHSRSALQALRNYPEPSDYSPPARKVRVGRSTILRGAPSRARPKPTFKH